MKPIYALLLHAIIFICCSFVQPILAQPIQPYVDKMLGSRGDDLLTVTVLLPDGGMLVGGYSDDVSAPNWERSQSGRGGNDYWIVRTDARGRKIWDRTYGGSGQDYLTSITANSDGSFLLIGISSSDRSGEKSRDSYGADDFWVVKISSTGQVIWDQTIGSFGTDAPWSSVSTADGGVIIVGVSNSFHSVWKTEDPRGGTQPITVMWSITGPITEGAMISG
ncbi:hypothetical protein QNI16_37755 [Cytophagaceae bacterium YF14B1]|uniref:Uncharacterized protein n=1 Tax=Xanthocytophaga flava TaxID=3048013 RepID=A0AAE3UBZ7_9BACT|nr:hypothetical protein [Xanthocytophaga flavus]MDJ1486287.1 hypothetical protein [Xanthocytophaga flavus]